MTTGGFNCSGVIVDNGMLSGMNFSLGNIDIQISNTLGLTIGINAQGTSVGVGLDIDGLTYAVTQAGPNGTYAGGQFNFQPGGLTALFALAGSGAIYLATSNGVAIPILRLIGT